ncbi:MAG: TRAP transporter small permease subunit [Acidobacteriota bacterium]
MERWVRWAASVDRGVDGIGRAVGWLTLLMVLVGSYNAIMRYSGRFFGWNLASNAYIELQWYLFSLVFLLGAAYTARQNRHVRVDVLYGRLSTKGRAWVDMLGTLLLMLPFSIFALVVSWPSVRNSWIVREASPDEGGLPRYPIKAMILVAFFLLVLQGLSSLTRTIAVLRSDGDEPPEPGDGLPEEEGSVDGALGMTGPSAEGAGGDPGRGI